jgi:hypothetical protein
MRILEQILQAQTLARQHGGLLLSGATEYINQTSKLKWRCASGHVFVDNLAHVRSNRWCPECRTLERRRKKEELWLHRCEEAADNAGGSCIGKLSGRLKKGLYRFSCAEGHEWESTGASVVEQGSWCPYCAGNLQRSIAEVKSLAVARGGICLSDEYHGVDAKYKWKCSLGHTWDASFKKVESGQWCPTCAKAGISEEVCRTAFEQIFDEPFKKARPIWLRNDRGYKMEIDGYSKSLKVGFEYHGIQHFEYTKRFHTSEDQLKQRIQDDKLKERLCAEHGVRLIILDYRMQYEDFKGEIVRQAEALGVDLSQVDTNCEIGFDAAYVREDRLNELNQVADEKGGKLLSGKWLGVDHLYRMQCNKDGNIWRASGSELIKGAWCKKCAMRELHAKQIGDLSGVEGFAARHGGNLL